MKIQIRVKTEPINFLGSNKVENILCDREVLVNGKIVTYWLQELILNYFDKKVDIYCKEIEIAIKYRDRYQIKRSLLNIRRFYDLIHH
jgi:hypothetical protein